MVFEKGDFSMKPILKLLCPMILSISLLGCSSTKSAVVDAGPLPTLPAYTTEDVQPFDYAAMTEEVYIQLNDEPRIHSPIRTRVAPKDQSFTVFFREPMNRSTVQEALQKNKLEGGIAPELNFQWVEDRQLRLAVNAPWDEARPGGAYQLDFSGAKTQSGRVLAKTPEFIAAVEEPNQLWRISLDGKVREPISSFAQPFDFRENDLSDGRYLRLTRFQSYCQCDAMYPRLHALYDLQEKKIIPYPVDLSSTYSGDGTFYADAVRGVFYAQAPENAVVPKSETAVRVQVNGYVFGASFNQDRSAVVMAVGADKEQESDYDLVIHSLKSVESNRHVQVLHGGVPLSQTDGRKLPITFVDDGTRVYTQLTKPGTMEPLYYQYTWKTGGVSAQTPPAAANPWNGFKRSEDGMFTLYTDGNLYRGEQKVAEEMNLYNGLWVPGTHLIAVPDFATGGPESRTRMLKLYDAQKRQYTTIADHLPNSMQAISVSADGKWLYVSSNVNLK
jgi:hypothetical protein